MDLGEGLSVQWLAEVVEEEPHQLQVLFLLWRLMLQQGL
jgi:hypothetical protein